MIVAGVMCGTSLDGVDAAAVDVAQVGKELQGTFLRHADLPMPPGLRRDLLRLRTTGHATMAEVVRLRREVSLLHARVLKPVGAFEAAGVHGVTLHHEPPDSWQLLDPAVVAAAAGVPVVSDLRAGDLAVGGQGAPLVPFGDGVLFRVEHPRRRMMLNLGGIANVTVLDPRPTVGYDVGPANCLSDNLMRRHGRNFDAGGTVALTGTADEGVVAAVLTEGFFRRPPPKSTDVPEMLAAFDRHAGGLALPDALATAAAVVAGCVLAAADTHRPDDVVAAGGGVRNAAVAERLRAGLAERGVAWRTTAELGVPIGAREAACFAVLAAARLMGVPANVPAATGASRPVLLGSVTTL